MDLKFRDDIITHIPTCCLIEDYQALAKAIENYDWDEVDTVMQCLSETITRYTKAPEGLDIAPSVSSIIAMSCYSGIVMNGNKDLNCAMGKPVSKAMDCECRQCPDDCPYWLNKSCRPEYGQLALEGGISYKYGEDDDRLLNSLSNM